MNKRRNLKGRRGPPKRPQNPQRQARKAIKKTAKIIGRGMVKSSMASVMGDDAANFVYSSMSRGMRGTISRPIRPKQLVLSRIASQYLQSYLTPFAQGVKSTGIPKPPNQPTFKTTGFVRGVGYIGAAGVGYIAFSPTLANNGPCVYYTTTSYGMSLAAAPPQDGTLAAYKTGGSQYPAWTEMSNLPFTQSQLHNNLGDTDTGKLTIDGRIVSCSLSIQYTGTEVSRSGQYYAYADPDMANVLGAPHDHNANSDGYDTGGLSQKDACEISPATRKGVSVTVIPNSERLDDFPPPTASEIRCVYPYSNYHEYIHTSDNLVAGAAPAIIMITGVKDMPFYYEAVIHAEYIGPGVYQALLTESGTDVVGYDAVKSVLSKAQRRVAGDARTTLAKALRDEMKREAIVFGTGMRSVDY